MRILKKSLFCSLLLTMALFLSSCAVTERKEVNNVADSLEEWKEKSPKDMPERLNLELKGGSIKIDGFLEVSKEISDWKVEEVTLKRHLFDETECLDDLLELLGNPKVLEREKRTKEDALEDGTLLKVDSATLEDGAFAQGRNAYFLANFPERIQMNNITNDFIKDWEGSFDDVEKDIELAFGSCEGVCKETEKFLKKQKIENLLEPMIYSFTPELLQKVADAWYQDYMTAGDKEMAEGYKLSLGEEDGVYLIRYTQGHRGVPYNYLQLVENDVDGTNTLNATHVELLYGKSGVQSISGNGFFDKVEVGEEREILSLYDVLSKISESFDGDMNHKTLIKEIGLCYLPIVKEASKLEFTGVPVWYMVYSDEAAAKLSTSRKVMVFDARTGEMLR